MDLELGAAGNTEVVKAKLRTMQNLRLDDYIEDILITLGKQYHIIRSLDKVPDLFLYCVLDKSQAILALVRRKMQDVGSIIRLEWAKVFG